MKRTVQSVFMLVALWGALLTIALYQGWEMPRWLNRTEQAANRAAGEAPDATSNPTAATDAGHGVGDAANGSTSITTPSGDGDGSQASARYHVCTSAAPTLSWLPLDDHDRALAVHCGDRVHVIHVGEQAAPTRIAVLTLPSANPGEQLAATSIVAADTTADGLIDLIVPVLTLDAWQHPRGRHVLLLAREVSGGFRSGSRVISASPLAVIAGSIDSHPGSDFVVLHATQENVKKPREAWWFSGGSTPKRTAVTPLSTSTTQLTLVDLDRDKHQDLVALSPLDARMDVLFGNGDGTATTTTPVNAAGCQELLTADLNGDAHPDVLCVGEQNVLIEARATREPQPRGVSLAGERVRSLQTADLNADGKLDLVGYAHPQIVRLEQTREDHFEPRLVAELRGSSFSPVAVLIVDVDHDDLLDAVFLGNSPSDPNATDLAIVRDVSRSMVIRVSDETIAIADAPLMLTPALQ